LPFISGISSREKPGIPLIKGIATVTGGSEAIFSPQRAFLYTTRWIADLMVAGQFILLVSLLLKQRSVSLIERASWFGNNDFAQLVQKRDFERIIKNFGSRCRVCE
jgi:hypothetical protein